MQHHDMTTVNSGKITIVLLSSRPNTVTNVLTGARSVSVFLQVGVGYRFFSINLKVGVGFGFGFLDYRDLGFGF